MFRHFDEIKTFISNRKSFGIKPGLGRMTDLLSLLGHPEERFKSIHIAGTNGKGSTIEFMKNALKANGYCVGVFTSPSISGLTGHIWHNDQKASNDEWIDVMNEMYPIIRKLDDENNHPTTFEIITAIAFMYFSKHVDIALVETGMGGRYDTTNCLQPILSIITNVAMDHTNFLGNRLEEIAYHKAGIIKKGVPVILGDIHPEVLPVFEKEAAKHQDNIYRLHHDFDYEEPKRDKHGQTFIWQYDGHRFNVSILMKGMHQIENGSLAMMALRLLYENGYVINWTLSLQGLHDTALPGRFEKVHAHPTIIVDGAHNPAGAKSFVETVQTIYPSEEKHLIFAAYKDKDIKTMLDMISHPFKTITFTSFLDDRAATSEFLYQLSAHDNKRQIANWKRVVEEVASEHQNTESIYFITGSLAFISEVRSFLLNN